jgi:hypothetical protein
MHYVFSTDPIHHYGLRTRGKSLELERIGKKGQPRACMEGCVAGTRRDVNPSPHSQVEA